MQVLDLADEELRAVNARLQGVDAGSNETAWEIRNPRGRHAIAVGLDAPLDVSIAGPTGYYCGGMNQRATLRIRGNAGPGVAENMMSGRVVVEGDASQYAGAT
ncbi:MAG: protein GlxC, partial [Pseudomonadota bacterium]